MKDTPSRIPQSLLLVISILFAGTSAQTKAQSPAASPQANPEELSRSGPALPPAFTIHDFRFKALFKFGWGLSFVSELWQPGTVTVTVTVDGHEQHPFVINSPQTGPGLHMLSFNLNHVCTIPLPGGIGAATYSVKAVPRRPQPGGVPFIIRSIAAGPRGEVERLAGAVSPPEGFALPLGARLTDAAYGLAPAGYQAGVPLTGFPSFTPRDILVVGGKPAQQASYSFRARFNVNGAETKVYLESPGYSAREVSRQSFHRRLRANEIINGTWDCMRDGSPSLGKHRLYVSAWRTVPDNGMWAVASSGQVVVRRP